MIWVIFPSLCLNGIPTKKSIHLKLPRSSIKDLWKSLIFVQHSPIFVCWYPYIQTKDIQLMLCYLPALVQPILILHKHAMKCRCELDLLPVLQFLVASLFLQLFNPIFKYESHHFDIHPSVFNVQSLLRDQNTAVILEELCILQIEIEIEIQDSALAIGLRITGVA